MDRKMREFLRGLPAQILHEEEDTKRRLFRAYKLGIEDFLCYAMALFLSRLEEYIEETAE